ncbi:MAG TPA: hypothetical protein VGR12_04555 [Solirubrobacteraceae bacterium]|nr:hypothetical protein [Solirubrobacteraceae bacterium]
MRTEQFAALLGFAFVAVWAGVGFGPALLALIVAGAAYAVSRFAAGELDVGEVRDRVEGARAGFQRQGGGAATSSSRTVRSGPTRVR